MYGQWLWLYPYARAVFHSTATSGVGSTFGIRRFCARGISVRAALTNWAYFEEKKRMATGKAGTPLRHRLGIATRSQRGSAGLSRAEGRPVRVGW